MAGRRSKKGGGGEHENAERWLLTYADMITLLVAFFIMLYAMSVMNQAKFQQLAISVKSGFGNNAMNGVPTIFARGGGSNATPSIINSSKSGETSGDDQFIKDAQQRQEANSLERAFGKLKAYIGKGNLQSKMQVIQTERGIVVRVMTDKMLFASGDASLRPEELGLLNTLAAVLQKTVPDNPVRVEGHTDNLPIHTAQFPSNWELSTMRATTVLRYFESRGISSKRLEAAGYADQRPISPNDTDEERGHNRRVDVVIMKRFAGKADPSPAP